MRFPVAALLLVVTGFIFLAFFAFGSFLISETGDALIARSDSLDPQFGYQVNIVTTAFGIIGAIMITMAVIIFVVESFSDEPEYYWRDR